MVASGICLPSSIHRADHHTLTRCGGFAPAHQNNAEWLRLRQHKLSLNTARIHAHFAAEGDEIRNSTRGTPQAVVCLDVLGEDGRPLRFESEVAAGKFAAIDGRPRSADHIRRAIVRGGRCGGLRFAWANGRRPTAREIQRERLNN